MDKTPLPHGTKLPDIGYDRILETLPHRYPMLLLDKLVDGRAFESATGIKNVTFNEPFFMGHFPGDPIMPGVMIIEAMAQSAAVLAIRSLGPWANGSSVYFMGVDEAKFRRPVRPGDQLRLEVALDRYRLGVWKYSGRAMVGGELAAEALLTAKLMTPT